MLVSRDRGFIVRALYGVGAAALVLPALSLVDGTATSPATDIVAVAIACAAAAAVHRLLPYRPSWVGGLIVAGSAWLFSQAPLGTIEWIIAAELGVGLGLAWPRRRATRDVVVLGFGLVAAVLLGVVAALAGAGPAEAAGTCCGLALVAAVALDRRPEAANRSENRAAGLPQRASAGRWTLRVATSVTLAVLLLLGAWIGANSTTAGWFGNSVSHGRRDRPLVALTFDDGPNATTTLAIRDILDAYGVKGTFFTVGKALDDRPDISRALLEDGQLLGNHSYQHDEWRWLDPRYLELGRTQRAFQRDLGVCPALFRPPHGQHTPFMADVVHARGMQMVTWDVSVGDWATHDAQLIARRVLDKVRPGSIIDLHDGLDGNVTADRSVLIRALPIILDGLHARALEAVRLDKLLGVAGYIADC